MSALDLLASPACWANPFPLYAELRPRSPFRVEVEGETVVGLMKYRHVYDTLRDHGSFSSRVGSPFAAEGILIRDDPPRHAALRATINRAFTPRRVATLEPWVSAIAAELLDGLEGPEVEIVDALTMPFPVRVIARLLGVPEEDFRRFKEWSDRAVASGGSEELGHYFAESVYTHLRRNPDGDDLIGALIRAEVDGEHLTLVELVQFSTLLLIAGNETTTNLMSNMLGVLAQRPDLWSHLRSDRSLVEPLIEEALRYESPVQHLFRRATRDVEIDGVAIAAGSPVAVYFGAANRDGEEFPEPDVFRLDRNLGQHVAFGMGIHFCLGAPLARMEARITLNALLDRFSAIEPGAEPATRVTTNPSLFGFARLPVRLQA